MMVFNKKHSCVLFLVRSKANKEENLDAYFSTTSCDIYSYVFLENKNKFLGVKKWVKRVGMVEENHFKVLLIYYILEYGQMFK